MPKTKPKVQSRTPSGQTFFDVGKAGRDYYERLQARPDTATPSLKFPLGWRNPVIADKSQLPALNPTEGSGLLRSLIEEQVRRQAEEIALRELWKVNPPGTSPYQALMHIIQASLPSLPQEEAPAPAQAQAPSPLPMPIPQTEEPSTAWTDEEILGQLLHEWIPQQPEFQQAGPQPGGASTYGPEEAEIMTDLLTKLGLREAPTSDVLQPAIDPKSLLPYLELQPPYQLTPSIDPMTMLPFLQAEVPSPPPHPEEEVEKSVEIAELPGEEAGALRKMVEAALAAGREVEVMTPEGKTLPLMQAPGGLYGEGGYMDIPEGPLTLMRKGLPEITEEELSNKVMENPFLFIQRTESKMGRDGLSPDRRRAIRQSLSELLVENGFDPGMANLYAQNGLAGKELNQMLSKEFSSDKSFQLQNSQQMAYEARAEIRRQAEEQRAMADRKNLALFEAMLPALLKEWVMDGALDPIVLQAYPGLSQGVSGTTVRMTDKQRDMLLEEAKALGYRGAVVVLPTGQILTPLFKHRKPLIVGGFLVSNTKENREFRNEALSKISRGQKLPDDIYPIYMQPQRVSFGGAQEPSPLMGGAPANSSQGTAAQAAADTAIKRMGGK